MVTASERKLLQTQQLRSEPSSVRVFFQEYPLEKAAKSTHATVFLPGWAMRGDSAALRETGREMSRARPHSRNFTLSTRPLSDSVPAAKEVEAISDFIKEQGITQVTLMGYSEGATRAISVAAELQKDSQVSVDGLVLISPMGLTPFERTEAFTSLMKAAGWYIPVNTLLHIAKKPQEWKSFFRGLRAAGGVLKGALEEVSLQKLRYPSTLRREIREVSKQNPFVDSLSVPVVVVGGEVDNVVRREVLQRSRKHFQLAPTVFLSARKLGNHGLPFVRPEAVVRASLHTLHRISR